MNITLLNTEYYRKAVESIPKDHAHRDEIVSLLIDQVIDDAYGDTIPDRTAGTA